MDKFRTHQYMYKKTNAMKVQLSVPYIKHCYTDSGVQGEDGRQHKEMTQSVTIYIKQRHFFHHPMHEMAE